MKNNYKPGSCNLGQQEIDSRIRKAWIAFILTIAVVVFIQMNHYPREGRLLVFFPLFYSIICYYQAKKKFCVVFGMRGIFNFESLGKSTHIRNAEHNKFDKKLAIQMTITCFLLAMAIVFIYYLIPF